MKRRMLALALTCVAAAAAPANGQSGDEGSIEGVVADETGAVIGAATVTVRSPATGAIFSTLTDRHGVFRFLVLPVGIYSVTAESRGFARFEHPDVRLTVGAKVTLPVVLEIGKREESVSVTAGTPLIEPRRTSMSATVDQWSVASLPLNGRNFVNFVLLTPGIGPGNTGNSGGFFSVAGQASMNSLLVDGIDQNGFGSAPIATAGGNRYLFSQEAIQELQVNTASYSPEFGRAGTAVVNVVTKSGTNDVQGAAFWYYRNDALSATGPIEKINGEAKAPFDGQQFGGALGGPIVHNRLFFYGSYDGQRRHEENRTILNLPAAFTLSPDAEIAGFQRKAIDYLAPRAARYGRRFVQDVVLTKIDWRATPNALLRASWNRHRFAFTNTANAGPLQSFEHNGTARQYADTIALALTSVLGQRSVNVGRFSYVGNHDPQSANSNLPEANVIEGDTVLWIGRAARLPVDNGVWRTEWADTLSLSRRDHALKFGGSLIGERARFYSALNFWGSYTFGSLEQFGRSLSGATGRANRYVQAFSGQGTPPIDVSPFCVDVAAFAQDSWRLHPSLTLDLGARYEAQVMRQSPVRNPSPALAAAGIDTSYIPSDRNNVAPRFGFVWSPRQGQRFVLRGGFGLYFPRLLPATVARAFFQNGVTVQTRTLPAPLIPSYPSTACGRPDPSGASPACATPFAGSDTLMAIPRTYRQSVIRQASVAAEFALGSNLALSVTYLRAAGDQLTHWQDVNLTEPITQSIGMAGTQGSVPYRYYAARPIAGFERILLLETNGSSRYDGFIVDARKRLSHGFQLSGSYTLGHAVDDNPTLGALNPGPGDGGLLSDSLMPALDRGHADTDERQRIVASGVWELPNATRGWRPIRVLARDWAVSGILAVDSGLPYTGVVSYDLNHDGNASTDRAPWVERNTFLLPATMSLDLRVTRKFGVARHAALHASCDAFNLFNRVNISNVKRTQFAYEKSGDRCGVAGAPCLVPVSGFGTPSAALTARAVQLSVKLLF